MLYFALPNINSDSSFRLRALPRKFSRRKSCYPKSFCFFQTLIKRRKPLTHKICKVVCDDIVNCLETFLTAENLIILSSYSSQLSFWNYPQSRKSDHPSKLPSPAILASSIHCWPAAEVRFVTTGGSVNFLPVVYISPENSILSCMISTEVLKSHSFVCVFSIKHDLAISCF